MLIKWNQEGASGVAGVNGVQGTSELAGSSGTQVIQGFTGPAGAPGATGAAGAQGAAGPAGPTGPSGTTNLFGTSASVGTGSRVTSGCMVGEVVLGAANFAFDLPADGRLISISSNTALYSVLGTRYGGNGRTDFALPDLRGVTPKSANGAPLIYAICAYGNFPTQL